MLANLLSRVTRGQNLDTRKRQLKLLLLLTTVSLFWELDLCTYNGAIFIERSRPLGTSIVRAGWSYDEAPRHSIPPLMARYKDRKLNRTFTFIGSDVYADGTARGQAKNIYEPGSNIANNWDVLEGVLDYVFVKMGIDGASGGIGRPVVMTEPVANLGYSRKSELSFCFD